MRLEIQSNYDGCPEAEGLKGPKDRRYSIMAFVDIKREDEWIWEVAYLVLHLRPGTIVSAIGVGGTWHYLVTGKERVPPCT